MRPVVAFLAPSRNLAGAVVLALAAGACGVVEGAGSALGGLTGAGSAATQPASGEGPVPSSYCPQVLVSDGRSSISHGGSQVSISNIARECLERDDRSILVRVGVEGLALLGPSGGSGRFSVPVTFRIVRGDSVVATRVQNASVVIPAGQAQAMFQVVEGGLVVPPRTGEFDIEVGLGGGGGARRR
ncbi:hypothetical protein [Enterovirga rhinocerotis]|nr:hypothetical protein [Enterovirga rhinocerotis]